jgi:uncharacterized protein
VGWWFGKSVALTGTLAIAALPAFGFERCGITLRQKPGSWPAWIFTGVSCLFFLIIAIATGSGHPGSADTISFEATMPGLEEETFFRGLLLLALDKAFTARRRIFGADLGWSALLTSLLFGCLHGISYSYHHGTVSFDALHFLDSFVAANLLVWVRERTGSLVAPILAHNIGNVVFNIF